MKKSTVENYTSRLLALVSNVEYARDMRQFLESHDLIDKSIHQKQDDAIPVKQKLLQIPNIVHAGKNSYLLNNIKFSVIECNVRNRSIPPAMKMKEDLVVLLKRKKLWKNCLDTEIPKSWEKFDDLVTFDKKYFFSEEWKQAGDDVWEVICRNLNVKRVALKGAVHADDFRTPDVNLVWGNSSVVHHCDNGIRYTWDIRQCMFSRGNVSERHRMGSMNCEGEVVVDLYAGIGYFTLPIVVGSKAAVVHACEWNPSSVSALRKNLQDNKVDQKCKIYAGDNREVCPRNVADRVILGLLPTSQPGWKIACEALKKETGGILHIHDNVSDRITNQGTTNTKLSVDSIQDQSPNECRICSNILATLEQTSGSDYVHASYFNSDIDVVNTNSFGMTSDTFLPKYTSDPLHCKSSVWKRWALHISHSFCHILKELHNCHYKTEILHIEHVKSYAPHIHHLVCDLKCSPVC